MQAQYYKLEQTSERGYRLLPEKKYFVVNALIRLTGIEFCRSSVTFGPQPLALLLLRVRRGWEGSAS